MMLPEEIKKEGEQLRSVREAVMERMVTLLLAGFGFVAALAWNEAIQALVKELFPFPQSGLIAKFVYAIIITVVLTLLSLRLTKLTKKEGGS